MHRMSHGTLPRSTLFGIALLLIAIALAAVVAVDVVTDEDSSADSVQFTVNGIKYETTSDTEVKVIANSYSGSVTIPASVTYSGNVYSVTSIGDYVFRGSKSLFSVTIPDSVTSIGNNVFTECTSLTSVIIGNGVVSIRDYSFSGCKSLTSLKIGNSVLSIGDYAIQGCESLTSVIIPDKVTSIGKYAFNGCKSLTSITIPSSVTSIGESAFRWCTSLASVDIGNSIASISDCAFSQCVSLTEIKVSEDNSKYCSVNGVLFNKERTTLIKYPAGISNQSYVVPNCIIIIGSYAFVDCTHLTSVTIQDNVTSIGSNAFAGCIALNSVNIPNSVKSVGGCAFTGCTSLTVVTIPDSVNSIGAGAFKECTSLTRVYFNSICCKDLESTSNVFSNAGSSGTGIEVVFGNKVSMIPSYLFSDNNSCSPKIKSLFISGSVISIGNSAFYRCEYLDSVCIQKGVTSIGHDSFRECKSLASIALPDSVKSINDSAFSGCTSLTAIALPNSVLSVGNNVFFGCTSLKSVIISESVTSIGYGVFTGCGSLTEINVSEYNRTYSSIDGVLFDKERLEFIKYPLGKIGTSYSIPGGVRSICSDAFYGCESLTTVVIPDSVNYIGVSAFMYCTSLNSVILSKSMTTIERNLFYGCTSLTSITIPDSVTTITGGAFSGCTSLTSVTIGKSLMEIGSYSFYRCTSLASVTNNSFLNITKGSSDNGYVAYYADTVIGQIIDFSVGDIKGKYNNNSNIARVNGYNDTPTSLVLDKVMIDGFECDILRIDYQAFYKCKSLTSVSISDRVRYIGDSAFMYCSSLTSVDIGSGVVSIDDHAFCECSALTSVTIGDGVTYIDSSAFAGCMALTSIYIPKSVTSIENYVFNACGSLTEINVSEFNSEYCSVNGVLFNKEKTNLIQYPIGKTETSYSIPDGVRSICSNAFRNCTNLKSVSMSSSITYIGDNAFYDCTYLKSVSMSSSITYIGDNAFSKCTNLTSVTIPNNVTHIGSYAFLDCTYLKSVTNNSLLSIIKGSSDNGYVAYYADTVIGQIIDFSVGEIKGKYNNNSNIARVTGYNGTPTSLVIDKVMIDGIECDILRIDYQAFYKCQSLTSVSISDRVRYIGDSAFMCCSSLTSVTIGNSIGYIGDSTFYRCTSLTSITIPNSVISIGNDVFYQCTSLTSVTIPDSVKSIGSAAFALGTYEYPVICDVYGCSEGKLDSCMNSYTKFIYNGSSYTVLYDVNGGTGSVDSESVSGEYTLKSYDGTRTGCKFIGWTDGSEIYEAGSKVDITDDITFYAVWERTDGYTFTSDTEEGARLTYKILREPAGDLHGTVSVKSVPCDTSGPVTIPNLVSSDSKCYDVISVGSSAFYGCSSLTSITMPDTVSSIGDMAFCECSSLGTVILGNNVRTIGSEVFDGCDSLGSIDIPASVESIGDMAFYNCTSLTAINVSDENSSYSSTCGVLFDTDRHTLLQYPAGKSETEYVVPESVTTISLCAFMSSQNLVSVTISKNVTDIGTYAFVGSVSLESISVSSGNSRYTSDSGVLIDSIDKKLFHYPGAKKDTSYAVSDGIVSMNKDAFSDCIYLSSLTLSDTVESIETWSFADLSCLTYVDIGNGVETIGSSAFERCTSLRTAVIGSGIRTIDYLAFHNCPSMSRLYIGDGEMSIGHTAFGFGTNDSPVTCYVIGCSEGKLDAYKNTYTTLIYCEPSFTVTYDVNGGTGSVDSESVSGEYTLKSYDGTRTGCKFIGWTDGSQIYEAGSKVDIANDITFYAVWERTDGQIFTAEIKTGFDASYKIIREPAGSLPGTISLEGIADKTVSGEIIIPDNVVHDSRSYSVVSMGHNALNYCTSLTSVFISDRVTSINSYAFQYCTSLTEINVSENNSSYCSVDGVLFDKEKTTLKQYPVGRSNQLYTIPDSVTVIENIAFQQCMSLIAVTIPDSVIFIGSYAFSGCSSLTSMIIPDSVTSISIGVFGECTSLTEINVSENNSSYCSVDGVLFDKEKTTLKQYPVGRSNQLYTIPDCVRFIDSYAFRGCTSLISVAVPNSLTSIGSGAFSGCSSLTSVTIPDCVKSIGNSAFSKCTSLISITIPDSVTSIDHDTFSRCTSLTSVIIGNSITYIGCDAFSRCTSLASVIIPDSVTYIDSQVFSGCTSLTSVTIPDSVRSIDSYAFALGTSSKSVTCNVYGCSEGKLDPYKNSYTTFIYNVSHTVSYNVNGGTGSVDSESVSGEYTLKSYDGTRTGCKFIGWTDGSEIYEAGSKVDIADDITFYAVWERTDEKTFNAEIKAGFDATYQIQREPAGPLPGTVSLKTIVNKEISGDVMVSNSVVYDDGIYAVTSIGSKVFYYCEYLNSVTIPDSVTSIGDGAFYGCTSLTSANIPNSVISIGDYAFSGCKSLTSVSIPDSVISIGDTAFSGCSLLTSITIPETATFIGRGAFQLCTSLVEVIVSEDNSEYCSVDGVLFNKEITILIQYPAGKLDKFYIIPNSVISIGDYAFRGCAILTSVTIPDSVTSLGYCAFDSCTSLTSVTIPDSVTSMGNFAFNGCSSMTFVILPDSITSISCAAFQFCKSLTAVTIPDSVTSIEESAFSYCSSLTSVIIPEGITTISRSAFQLCTSLTSVKVPNGVTSIEDFAFSKCTSLTCITIPKTVTFIGNDKTFQGCKFYDFDGITELPQTAEGLAGYTYKGDSCTKLVRQREYTVTFQNDAGDTVDTKKYFEGTSIEGFDLTIDKDPTAQYTYTQTGWQYEDGTVISFPITIDSDMTVMPVYKSTLRYYDIKFISQDETYASYHRAYGTQFASAPSEGPTKDSDRVYMYEFKEWNTSADGKGESFSKFTVSKDVTYYAIFERTEIEYTVNVSASEGCDVTGGGKYTYNSNVVLKAVPKDGFRFVGWYSGDTMVSRTSAYNITVIGDMSFTAVCERAIITSIETVNLGKVAYGTAFGDLELPDTVRCRTSVGTYVDLSVTWDSSGYSPTKVGLNTISGMVDNGDYVMKDGVSASACVTVNPDSSPRTKEITAISYTNSYSAQYGTPFASIGVKNAVGQCSDGSTVELTVAWQSGTYDPISIGEQTVKGKISLPFGYYVSVDSILNIEITVNVISATITSIEEIDLGILPLDIAVADIGLPSTVPVTVSDGDRRFIPVTWDTSKFISVEGEQTIPGVLVLPAGYVLGEGLTEAVEAKFTLSSEVFDIADIVFIIDTTGSMSDEITNVKNNIKTFASDLEGIHIAVRWALVEYRDITCDGMDSTRIILNDTDHWYPDADSFAKAIGTLRVNGGGDYEETIIDAMEMARTLDYRDGAMRFYIDVTDADYKVNNRYGVTSMDQEIENLISDGTHVFVITETYCYPDYKELADRTGGMLLDINGSFSKELMKIAEMIGHLSHGDVRSIEIEKLPNKLSYKSGEYFDPAGMKVIAVYEDGARIEVENVYSIDKYNPLQVSDTSITVEFRGATASFDITVEDNYVPVTSVSLDKSSLPLYIGNTGVLTATVNPSDATNRTVVWVTSNSNVASVNGSGIVTAWNEGTAVITVCTNDGGFTASCSVTVTKAKSQPTGVVLNTNSIGMGVGSIETLIATVYPEDAEDKTVAWSSSDTSIVTVENGVITAHSVGYAVITVRDVAGNEDYCSVIVRAAIVFMNGDEIFESYKASDADEKIRPPERTPTKDPTLYKVYTFTGWQGYTADMKAGTGHTFYAMYEESTRYYSVQFLDDDDSVISSLSLTYGSEITVPEDPVKESTAAYSYTFRYWADADGNRVTVPLTVSEDYTVYASYERHDRTYTVKFTVDSEVYDTFTGKYGEKIELPKAPTKAPTATMVFTFSKWSPTPSKITGEQTFAAVFTETAREYTVTYVADRETIAVMTHANGTAVNVSECRLEGYDLTGWTSDGVSISEGKFTMPAEDVTVTCVKTVHAYTVKYYVDSALFATRNIGHGSMFINLVPSKSPTAQYTYLFAGWQDKSGSTVDTSTPVYSDMNVYAKFTKNTNSYLISFVDWDDSVIWNGYMRYGSTITAPKSPVKADSDYYRYTFAGWDGYTAGMKVTGKMTFRALYDSERIYYNVFYKVDDTVVFTDRHQYNESVAVRAPYTMTGYDVSGWNVPVAVDNGHFSMPKHDITITAVSEPQIFDVRFWNGDTLFSSYEAAYGSEIVIPDTVPVKGSTAMYSYKFAYWAADDGKRFVSGTVTGDVDIHAVFAYEYISYTVTFVSQGVMFAEYELFYGMEYVVPGAEPIKEPTEVSEYSFREWNTEADGSGEAVTNGYVTGDITLYAIFDTHTREFDVRYIYGETELFVDSYVKGTEVTLREPYSVMGYTTSWDAPVTVIDGRFTMPAEDVTITLVLDPISCILTFYDEDKVTVLYGSTVSYGTGMPSVKEPTKASTAQYEHSFAGWKDMSGSDFTLPETVTSDISVYASYEQNVRSYYVIYYSDTGALISSELMEYGTVIVPLDGPAKESDGKFTYTFIGWEGYEEGMKVLKRTTFTALYEKVPIIPDKKDIVIDAKEDQYIRFTDENISDMKEKAKTEDVSLTVTVSEGTVVFDKEAVLTFTEGNDLTITRLDKESMIESVQEIVGDSPTFEIYFGTNREFGEGTATVTIPYTLSEGEDPNDLVIYYISDGRVAQRIDCTYSEGFVTFSTNHFSTYAIVSEPSQESTDSGMNMGLIIEGIVGAIVLLAVAAVMIKRH